MFKKKKNTNYIFTFGNVGAGKSTLMAALVKFLSLKAILHINDSNTEGTNLLFDWIDKLDDNQFPERTRKGEIIEIDLGLEFSDNSVPSLQLTFLEMAGEDLNKVDIKDSKTGTFEQNFTEYIKQSKAFIIVTDIDRAKKDDRLIMQFLNHLSNRGADMSLVGLVIAKWDMYKGDKDKKGFVSENMPMTLNWLFSDTIEQAQVFTFSIGKVQNSNSNTIETLNLGDTKQIAEWIYSTLVK
jgi:GTPase SAR1 family protein